MGDLFDRYRVSAGWDEMFERPGVPRIGYEALSGVLQTLSADDFDLRCVSRDRAFRDQGITFSLSGEERPFPLDLVPRVVDATEWSVIESGLRQRVLALEAFLADVYGPGHVLSDGVVPRRLVTSATHFHREATGIEPPNGVRVHVAGIDLVRGADGRFVVLEDNLRTPSGISYVIENRRAMTHVFPELFTSHRVRPVADYPARLLEALRSAAPAHVDDPTVVVLTPGVHNSAYFEHSFLARQMGVELVEGRDLVCLDGVVHMRTTTGEQRVDVVYRRVDDEFLDPLQFRPDSLLGCPGMLNAARAGAVTIANAVGNGVADDKALYPYVPALIDYYLGERPVLENVATYRLDEPDSMAVALLRIDQLVFKPVDGSGGHGLVIGPQASDAELAGLRDQVIANPRGWIAQEVVALSTAPTYTDSTMAPRHVDLRPFAVNDGRNIWVVPGGLTRVALPEGSLVVNSSQGGGSKDTWVLTGSEAEREAALTPPDHLPRTGEQIHAPGARTGRAPSLAAATTATGASECLMLSRIAESLFWFGRYVERAEDTARILDVHYHLLLEDPGVDEQAACRALLEVMGQSERAAAALDAQLVTEALAYDADSPCSIVGALTAAWENARGAREAVSAETWRCLNATYQSLPSSVEPSDGRGPHAFFDWVKERASILAGLTDSTMSRDDGWRFLILGRSLERADMTVRLLSARYTDAWGHAGWVTTLRCCSAHEAYLRTYHRAVDASLAAEFLLLDRLFPRSLFHALSTAEGCLADLDPRLGRTGLDDKARRLLGRARTGLEFVQTDDLLAHLPERLVEVQEMCAEAADAVAWRYFPQTSSIAWTA